MATLSEIFLNSQGQFRGNLRKITFDLGQPFSDYMRIKTQLNVTKKQLSALKSDQDFLVPKMEYDLIFEENTSLKEQLAVCLDDIRITDSKIAELENDINLLQELNQELTIWASKITFFWSQKIYRENI